MEELDKLRGEIDRLDSQLVRVLEQRLGLVEEVLKIKRREGLPIYHPQREQEVVAKVAELVENKAYEKTIGEIYLEIMKASKRLQSAQLVPFNIVLMGFMGTGKTSIGKYLSQLMEMELVDIDELLVSRMNMSINKIFEIYGEEYFRGLETTAIEEVSQRSNLIISCGGGVVLNPRNIEALRETGRVIWLKAQPETLYQRLQEDDSRPLLKNNLTISYINALLTERWAKYEAAADFTVDTDTSSIEEISKMIIHRLTKD